MVKFMLPIIKMINGSALFALFALFAISPAVAQEYRSIDGYGNNVSNDFGVAGGQLLRLLDNAYQDGVSAPRGGLANTLPSPRRVSNVLSNQTASVTNSFGASDWLWQWGQFLDHDIDLTLAAGSSFNITVPMGDPQFDPTGAGNAVISFSRSTPTNGTGTGLSNPREHDNQITSYIDGSNIYGSDAVRASELRNGAGLGQLTFSLADNGEVLPMRNTAGLPNDNGGSTQNAEFFLSGDIRANEQIGLTATHSLFVREHNRIATSLATRLGALDSALLAKEQAAINDPNNGVDDRDDFIYQSSRKVVGGLMQKVTYEEFLPMLIGNDLGSYTGYDSAVDASISTEFSTAAFRLGHTLLSPQLQRPGVGAIDLQDAFFNPNEVQVNGVDAILLGLSQQKAQALDNQLVDGVRNFLFGPPGAGGLDLASLNIQRGRDHGIPGYVETYNSLFGSVLSDFSDLGSDGLGLFEDDIVAMFEQAYGDVDEIDLWIGGISEIPDDHGGMLGPTFSMFLADQFSRTRDGDRFFYLDESLLADFRLLDASFDSTLLSDIILRNTGVQSMNRNAFVVAAVPEPGSIAVILLACLAVASRRKR